MGYGKIDILLMNIIDTLTTIFEMLKLLISNKVRFSNSFKKYIYVYTIYPSILSKSLVALILLNLLSHWKHFHILLSSLSIQSSN